MSYLVCCSPNNYICSVCHSHKRPWLVMTAMIQPCSCPVQYIYILTASWGVCYKRKIFTVLSWKPQLMTFGALMKTCCYVYADACAALDVWFLKFRWSVCYAGMAHRRFSSLFYIWFFKKTFCCYSVLNNSCCLLMQSKELLYCIKRKRFAVSVASDKNQYVHWTAGLRNRSSGS